MNKFGKCLEKDSFSGKDVVLRWFDSFLRRKKWTRYDVDCVCVCVFMCGVVNETTLLIFSWYHQSTWKMSHGRQTIRSSDYVCVCVWYFCAIWETLINLFMWMGESFLNVKQSIDERWSFHKSHIFFSFFFVNIILFDKWQPTSADQNIFETSQYFRCEFCKKLDDTWNWYADSDSTWNQEPVTKVDVVGYFI